MKRLFGILIIYAITSLSAFAQSNAGVKCTLIDGDEPTKNYSCKWYAVNNHDRAVEMIVKKTKHTCLGEIKTSTYTKKVSANNSSYLDRNGYPCMNSKKEKIEYSVVSKKFVE